MTRALALCVLFACGDNTLPDGEPLGTAPELAIVAAPGDDLVFVEPELVESVQAGSGATVVYVTAGDEAGTRAAWAVAAGATTWRCGWIELADHAAEHCRLDAANLSLVFLGYPAGGADGSAPDSLLNLWEANIDRASTRGARPASYDQPGLIAAVAEAITDTQPQIVRTQEIAATHGDDDSDHMLVGALALLAHAAATSPAELLSYRGDNIAAEPADQLTALVEELGPIAGTLAADPAYLARRYAVGFRRAASGAMTLDGGATCLAPANDGGVVLGPCAGAPSWQLDPSGELRDPMNQCIALLPTGELVVGDCVGGATRRFYLDDDGVIWTAVPPAAVADMATSHLWCLAPGGGRVRAQLCGATRAPAWSFLGATVATPRATLGMTATGRAVRIADLDGDGLGDLCAVTAAGLQCAPGDGAGGFAAARRIDSAAAPLAIDPGSLALGDVDGDGRVDACGHDAQGIVCALAAGDFAAERFTTALADAAPSSIAIAHGQVCGLTAAGVACAAQGGAASVLSAWPAGATAAWIGELDGDAATDWCAITPAGLGCAVAAETALTSDGSPWSYAQGGTAWPAPADASVGSLADVDGDGRADLCSAAGATITCARSQGRKLGPPTVLANLPAGTAATATWLGDLDGDGKADACVDAGASVVCALSP